MQRQPVFAVLLTLILFTAVFGYLLLFLDIWQGRLRCLLLSGLHLTIYYTEAFKKAVIAAFVPASFGRLTLDMLYYILA